MSEPVFVEVITFECAEAVEVPPQCPQCGHSLARFQALPTASGRVSLDAANLEVVESEAPDYHGVEFVYLARCEHCRFNLTTTFDIHGAGAVTSWHVRCLASYLHGSEDPRALGRLHSDLEHGPYSDGAWELALLEHKNRAGK